MALRKASAYSRKRARPFTRNSRTKNKAYIKVVPPSKIVKFHMGNQKAFDEGKHKYIIRYVSEEKIQIRDNSLESCRMLLNKLLEEKLPGQHYFVIKVYPHHLLRENKTAAGAGADRISSGMKHSYGIVIGRAAIVQPGEQILFVSCPDEDSARVARDIIVKIKAKVPCRGRIVFEKVA